mgnify:CR=1 FL=1
MRLLMKYPNYQRLVKEWPEETRALLLYFLNEKETNNA